MTSKHKAAVVVPAYRAHITEEEAISLSACRKHLANYSLCFAIPSSLPRPSWLLSHESVTRFPDKFFSYPYGYNRLLMSRLFYRAFDRFEYILIHQLDCLVFRDELAAWCAQELDYVGSPWFDDYLSPGESRWTVGNGGFSLRKISSALKVLNLPIRRGELYPIPMPGHPQPRGFAWLLVNIRCRMRQFIGQWRVEDELDNCSDNEDRFWSFLAPRLFPQFRIPSVEEALGFAFEMRPQECLAKTNGKLPFGCHAWAKVDRIFWETVMQEA